MDNHSLDEFRRRWQEELAQAQAQRKRRRPEAAERRPRRPEVAPGRGEQASGYLALAQGLLEGASRPPAARATGAERQDAASRSRSPPARDGAGGEEQLVDQLIRDLVSGRRLLPRPAAPPPRGHSPPVSWKGTPCVTHAGRKTSKVHTPPCAHGGSLEAVAPTGASLSPIWQCLQTVLDARRECGGASLRAEASDALEHPTTHRTALPPQVIWPKMLVKR